jgi:hypothetical protein
MSAPAVPAHEQPVAANPRQAWAYEDAVEASRRAQEAQISHERARREAAGAAAESEREYRKALADKMVELIAGGTAATAAGDLARGDKRVADLRYKRDVDVGVKDVMEQAAWRHTATRRDVTAFIEWSQRVAPLGEQVEGGR